MATVDFYILEEASGQKSLFFACQLVEKVMKETANVYIQANSREEAQRLDALLWTYKEDSFLPHQLYDPEASNPPPVQIGWDHTPQQLSGILLNLSRQIPPFYAQFTRVIEIVFSDPLVQQLARERFKHYRDQGCDINTYKLKANET